jgi:hypothetical protein
VTPRRTRTLRRSIGVSVTRAAGLLALAMGARLLSRIAHLLDAPLDVTVLSGLAVGALAAAGALAARQQVETSVQVGELLAVGAIAVLALSGGLGPPYPSFGPLRWDPVHSTLVLGVWLGVAGRGVLRAR